MLQNRKNWSDFEDKAILSLVKKYGTKNWAQISEKMSSKYGIETRTGKQCRERWHNHLNPDVNKQAWTEKEEKIMFEAHQKYGNKWTQIAKNFEGRTDNDIKNHFYSMLRRSLRRVNKLLGMRNSTQKIRQIKPSVLSKIFSKNGTTNNNKLETQQDWKKISQYLFQFSKSKSGDDLSNNLQENQKRKLQDLIQKIAKYNKQYETSQLIRKQSRRSKRQNQDSQEQFEDIPVIKKISSNNSKKSLKNKKIKKAQKKLSLKSQKCKEKPDKREKSKESKTKQQQPLPNQPKDEGKPTLQQQINLIFQLPQLQEMNKRTSSFVDLRKQSSSRSPNISFNSLSPRMDPRLSTTPQQLTPPYRQSLSSMFPYNLSLFLNNQGLDQDLNQTKKLIDKRTKRC